MSENAAAPAGRPEQTAGDVYEAVLAGPEHENVVTRAGRFVAEVASAAFGDDGSAFTGVRVVVRRKDDHGVIARLDGGNYEGDQSLLDVVRADLAELSPEEFREQWITEDPERSEESDQPSE